MIATALKNGKAKDAWVEAATNSMTRLNDEAATALHQVDDSSEGEKPVHAVTDVTGFGLLGHAREMTIGSGVSMILNHAVVAYLPGAIEAARGKNFSGGLVNNRQFLEGCVAFAPDVAEEFQGLFFDPQTSGGFLASIVPESVDYVMTEFEKRKIPARIIGEVVTKRSPLIQVI